MAAIHHRHQRMETGADVASGGFGLDIPKNAKKVELGALTDFAELGGIFKVKGSHGPLRSGRESIRLQRNRGIQGRSPVGRPRTDAVENRDHDIWS
jgi:hypothetical protein